MNSPANPGRRQFVGTVTKTLGASLLLPWPGFGLDNRHQAGVIPPTVGQIIELIIKTIPGAPFPKTVDTLKAGSPDTVVTGIVSTMFATIDVIEKAIARKANFIIAHEPTFYSHTDDTDWLQQDTVYRYKRDLLAKHNIAVWRFHDYIHAHRPDGVRAGVMDRLGWQAYADPKTPEIITLPTPMPLRAVVAHAKEKLGIQFTRVVGDASQPCQRVLLMPGAAGGRRQISAIEQTKPDVLLCGEVSEWETAEYVRDASASGQRVSLVVLGHEMSEEPGMEWLVTWLTTQLPGTPITNIPSGNPFVFL